MSRLAEASIIVDDTHIISMAASLGDPSVVYQALGDISKEQPHVQLHMSVVTSWENVI